MKRRVGYGVGVLLLVNGALLACSGEAELGAAGDSCQLSTDCEPGLACVSLHGNRVCSSDLSSIQGNPATGGTDASGGEDATAKEGGADSAAAIDSSSTDTGVVTDTGVIQDTGVVVDTGVIVDTGVTADTGADPG